MQYVSSNGARTLKPSCCHYYYLLLLYTRQFYISMSIALEAMMTFHCTGI